MVGKSKMNNTSKKLRDFAEHAFGCIRADPKVAEPTLAVVSRIAAALNRPVEHSEQPEPKHPPVCRFLDSALETARTKSDGLARLADALENLRPSLTWAPRSGADGSDPEFQNGHANAILVGPTGIEVRNDVWIGMTLMAPNLRYPDHRHPPEEAYLALSSGEWWKEGDDWFAPGIGGTLYNAPNILHAMRSNADPFLAIWCLPLK